MICLDVVTLFAPLLIYYKDLIGVTSGALGIVTSQFSCLESVRSPARQTLISKLVGKEPCMRSHSTRAANFSLSRDLVSIYRLSVRTFAVQTARRLNSTPMYMKSPSSQHSVRMPTNVSTCSVFFFLLSLLTFRL